MLGPGCLGRGAPGLPQQSVRVISPFVGGGFGSGLRTWPHTTIAAPAARETRRPVKLVLTRRQQYFGTGFRPAYELRVRLGIDRTGRLTGAYIVESAMDELAHELRADPIELRLRNGPGADPSTGLPFSTRRLRECYRVGAQEFGWQRRNPRPASTRDGDWLIGTGMAAAVYDTGAFPAQAHVRLASAETWGMDVVSAPRSSSGATRCAGRRSPWPSTPPGRPCTR